VKDKSKLESKINKRPKRTLKQIATGLTYNKKTKNTNVGPIEHANGFNENQQSDDKEVNMETNNETQQNEIKKQQSQSAKTTVNKSNPGY